MTCSNPRLVALYISRGSPGGGNQVHDMVCQALHKNGRHWHVEIRGESERVASLLMPRENLVKQGGPASQPCPFSLSSLSTMRSYSDLMTSEDGEGGGEGAKRWIGGEGQAASSEKKEGEGNIQSLKA